MICAVFTLNFYQFWQRKISHFQFPSAQLHFQLPSNKSDTGKEVGTKQLQLKWEVECFSKVIVKNTCVLGTKGQICLFASEISKSSWLSDTMGYCWATRTTPPTRKKQVSDSKLPKENTATAPHTVQIQLCFLGITIVLLTKSEASRIRCGTTCKLIFRTYFYLRRGISILPKMPSDTKTSGQNSLSETQSLLSQRALPQRRFIDPFYLIPQHS